MSNIITLPNTMQSNISPPVNNQIAVLLIENGLLMQEQLNYAYRIHTKLGDNYSLTSVLLDLGYINQQQLRATLRTNRQAVPLGNLLVELGLIKAIELRTALQAQNDPAFQNKRLGEVLVEMGMIQEQRLIEVLADQLDFLHEEPVFSEIDQALLTQISPDWCRNLQALPLQRRPDGILVAFTNPLDTTARLGAEAVFDTVIPAICTWRALEDAIKKFENSRQYARQRVAVSDEANTSRFVNDLIIDGLEFGASDIHIEPMRQILRIRMRRDGALILHKEVDLTLAAAITSRLKILASADITEKRRHQDGGFRFEDARTGRSCDVRASFYATIFGEKIVLRLLSRKAMLLDIKEVGLASGMLDVFLEDALDLPSGVVLITGPTGSGKTTSLYGCVNYLNDSERCIITAEEPVEYVIDGIAQCSLNPKINLTFDETLRHMVRQDPDVIVIGEIRDRFSADSAIQAALTGHKVLATFHTEDSIGGLLRLMNMQIESFLISSTVVSILAQRLLRRVCSQCAEPYRPTAHELQRIGWAPADIAAAKFQIGRGCKKCHFTGYAGRVGIFELLVLNEPVRDAILSKKTSSEIRRISIDTSGLVTLMEDGLAKAAQGSTSLQEALRHLPRLGRPRSLREIIRLVGQS
ncbi:GspE/PulE family protein [Thiospirillum jenense]|uniref:Flp pilus assembly complex ATPase component TadA n=1 Tax=Thiospirillum jenense TaxID=1653858 RepID=A0A839HGJ1_9GAMM|nr:GspE/PulE family protein [Thiospirillum jenense]MBB1126197.1 Flp pilus assembly complex ATPase component TadA [Thiospirillum jenense]